MVASRKRQADVVGGRPWICDHGHAVAVELELDIAAAFDVLEVE